MKSSPTAIVALLVLTCMLPMVPSAPSFGGGQGESTVNLAGPGEATVDLEIPAGYYVQNVTMNVTGMAAEGNSSAFPECVQLRVNDSVIWAFNGTGYGPLGRQDEFSTGSNKAKTEFGTGGGTNKLWMRLPKDAVVESATMEVAGSPQIKWQERLNIPGKSSESGLGISVSRGGDVNNDGYDDLIVGAYKNNTDGKGRVYIYYGGPNMDNNEEVTLAGQSADDGFGSSVSSAGDVNKDGYDDVIVGAYFNDAGGTDAGRAYIYYGGANMDSTPDIVLTGANAGDEFGNSVSDAGDVNNDGYDDIIIGAFLYDASNGGRAYIYYGGSMMNSTADVSLAAEADGDNFGCSVSGAGDVNGDGYDDVLVGATHNDAGGDAAGRAFLYLGGAPMDNATDQRFTGSVAGDYLGSSVSGAGDVNGDGYDDVIVGASEVAALTNGRAEIYYGGANMDNIADVIMKGTAVWDYFGEVSDAGDVNKDGYGDVVVGAWGDDSGGTDAGRAFIFYGGANMDNTADATFTGAAADDGFGGSVSGAGDVDNDGYDDVVVGASGNDANGTDTGQAYLYSYNYIVIPGIYDPAIKIGSTTIWSAAGLFNGTSVSSDFTKTLNDYLGTASPSGTDDFGNSHVNIQLSASANSAGTLSLNNLNVVYQYTADVPNFANTLDTYLWANQGKKDGNGNIIVPVKVSSQSSGIVKLSGLAFSQDMPPSQVQKIGTLELDEDTGSAYFLDLYKFFQDDSGNSTTLNFSVVSSTNSSIVTVGIRPDKRYLTVNAKDGDANDNWTGTVEVVVACSDRWGQKTESNPFTIIIRNVNDPPVFISTPITEATAGVPYIYDVSAIDGDKDLLRFSLSTAPANMTIDPSTGRIQWMPKARGNHTVAITVTDGNLSAEQDFAIYVPNVPPRITSTPSLNATVGVPYEYRLAAEDDNGDKLSCYLSGDLSQFDTLAPDNVINFTPTEPASLVGSINVSDGLSNVYQNFTITVAPAPVINHAPLFKSTPATAAIVGTPYFYNASATDPDTDNLTFSFESSPPGMTVDPATGKISWTPAAAGNFTVLLKVSDGKGAEAKQEFVIKVSDAVTIRPQLVLVSHQPGQTVKGTITISGTVTKGTREVSKVQLRIDGKEWTDAAGNYSWSLAVNTKSLKNGKHTFEFRAYDGKEYSDTVTAELRVDNPAAAPAKGFIPMMDGLMALALLGAAGAVSVLRRRQ